MVATNAGGTRVLRHGMMRQHVAGVEAVLPSGEVVSHLGGLAKDNTGFDMAGLLCGSEGILGVITRVRLRLIPVVTHRVAALLAWDSMADAVRGLLVLRDRLPGLEAAEYMVDRGVVLVHQQMGIAMPFASVHGAYLLVEVGGTSDPTPDLASAVEVAAPRDVAVAEREAPRQALWALRELHNEALARVGPPRKFDVTVPIDRVPQFVAAVISVVESRPGMVCHHFGHLGDGNVHVNVLGTGEVDEDVYGLVGRFGGSISAEHGIGRLKRPWLHLSRSAAEIAAFRHIKAALDPAAILNPGVLLPDR
jgi:FAD/FMN-containing dehydrogenase